MTWIISETDVEVIRNARRALKDISKRALSARCHAGGVGAAEQGMAVMLLANDAEDTLFSFLNKAAVHGHQPNAFRDIHRTAPYPEAEEG